MKKIKIKKVSLKIVALIVSSATLIFLLIWLGFSFFSMRSDNPYVGMLIDFEGNTLAEKVRNDYPKREGKMMEYSFPVILEQYTPTEDEYIITGIPFNYKNYFESRDEARFDYVLDRDMGDFDFTKLEWNDPLIVSFTYRVEKNLRYFGEFSSCTLKKFFYNIFNIDNPCARGTCYVKRDITSWEIIQQDGNIDEKVSMFDGYDRDILTRGLTNFFITDDYGYFRNSSAKISMFLYSFPDGTFQANTDYLSTDNPSLITNSSIFWVLSGASEIYKSNYEEYSDIDLLLYMNTLNAYVSDTVDKSFLSCQISYNIVSNLKGCNTQNCEEIKNSAFENCKKDLEREIKSYDSDYISFKGYDETGMGRSYLYYMPSEMIYYNKLINELNLKERIYNKGEIVSYYERANTLVESKPAVISNCYLLKSAEDIATMYGDNSYTTKATLISELLPDFSNICEGNLKNKHCYLSVAEKLVCADALMTNSPNRAQEVLRDIFYRHYFESPASLKINAYEELRRLGLNRLGMDSKNYLEEYGYFVTRKESQDETGTTVISSTSMYDSFYFIYLLNRITDEN